MDSEKEITLNGEPYELGSACLLPLLLERLNIGGKPVVVEHNGRALLPHDFAATVIAPGDRVEIISIVAGG